MTRDDIIHMARAAGFEIDCCSLEWHERIQRFAALVAIAEREACAKVCDEYDDSWYAYRKGAQECSAAIRLRSSQ